MAAEHMVCTDLLNRGYNAFLAGPNLRYDLVLDDGKRLHRVQVKSTHNITYRAARDYYWYRFLLGNGNHPKIRADEVDIVACVAMNLGQIAYLKAEECKGRFLQLHPPGTVKRKYRKFLFNIDELPLSRIIGGADENPKQNCR